MTTAKTIREVENMKIINKKQAVEKILAEHKKIFGVTFIKKDGSERDMVCRLGVKKGVTGEGMNYDPALHALLPVFDMTKDAFRMIQLKTITRLTINGKNYRVKQTA